VNISGGWKHAVALSSDGKVLTWGDNTAGQIGNGITSTVGISVPIVVPGLNNMLAVSGGDRFTAALKSDGTVWTWGWNGFGQLGDGTFTDRSSPVQVKNLSNVIYLAARDYHVLVFKSDGSVWAWGSNENGECGDDTLVDRNTPVRVLFPSTDGGNPLYLPLIIR
jgi:YD repeat-containing protein